MNANAPTQSVFIPVLGDFVPLSALWADGGSSKRLFPSESSARWFIRAHRTALIDARAIAQHTGRMLVNVDRLEQVAETVALQMVRRPTIAA